MAKTPSSLPFPYILEAEQNLPKNEQTVWWLRRGKVRDTAQALEGISKAQRQDKQGNTFFDGDAWLRSEKNTFCSRVFKIENYHFSDDAEDHADKVVPIINDEQTDMKALVFQDILDETRTELMAVASKGSSMSAVSKKKLDS